MMPQFMWHWNTEEMVNNYKTENPAADLRREHAATIHAQLEELQQTFKGSFFVAMYENEELQQPTFAEISPFSKFYDTRARCLVFTKPGENADFYCNHHQFSVCNCSALEIQLVECSKILVVCIQRSPAGNFKRYIIYHSAF